MVVAAAAAPILSSFPNHYQYKVAGRDVQLDHNSPSLDISETVGCTGQGSHHGASQAESLAGSIRQKAKDLLSSEGLQLAGRPTMEIVQCGPTHFEDLPGGELNLKGRCIIVCGGETWNSLQRSNLLGFFEGGRSRPKRIWNIG